MSQNQTKLLFVCMGNICRSPAAECFFRLALQEQGCEEDFYIESAGTGGWHVGNAPDRRMRLAAQKQGLRITGSARQITADDLEIFNTIICMDKDNLDDVISMGGNTEKTKLLLPFIGHESMKEVPDPYYGGEDGFDEVITLIREATKKLAKMLG
ncbi:MAG: low molecular weight phosphotyrosine protein phosphatase [Phycisphaerae bacterium]|jgi:protein-tyrosine phosphatase|nr:low molecular weight phosphotyrosine protein phosphatase [Phycisphaerae bacterium]